MVALPVRDPEADEVDAELSPEQAWLEYHDLYHRVRNMPRSEKINLLYVILDELMQQEQRGRKRNTVDEAWGRLKFDGPAPTDEEVRQIVIDELMERHG